MQSPSQQTMSQSASAIFQGSRSNRNIQLPQLDSPSASSQAFLERKYSQNSLRNQSQIVSPKWQIMPCNVPIAEFDAQQSGTPVAVQTATQQNSSHKAKLSTQQQWELLKKLRLDNIQERILLGYKKTGLWIKQAQIRLVPNATGQPYTTHNKFLAPKRTSLQTPFYQKCLQKSKSLASLQPIDSQQHAITYVLSGAPRSEVKALVEGSPAGLSEPLKISKMSSTHYRQFSQAISKTRTTSTAAQSLMDFELSPKHRLEMMKKYDKKTRIKAAKYLRKSKRNSVTDYV